MRKYEFDVPEKKKVRVIVHTDCKNEADDQFALAHHLMTPKFIVRGVIAGHFENNNGRYPQGKTVDASYDEVKKVMELMDVWGDYPVLKGSNKPLRDELTPEHAEGVDFIIREAMREDDRPLYIALQGAITDLACAILIEPEITKRMTAIWIGGGEWPGGGREFNLMQDIHAANVVMSSGMELWQIPINVYKQMAVSLAELQLRVKPQGEIGAYLFQQMVEFNQMAGDYPEWPHGETWGLGDQPTVTVLLDESERINYEWKAAPRIAEDMSYVHGQNYRKIRVYHTVDARLTMEDFYAKLALNFGS